ncbi:MAG: aldolase, partial [Candidatus Omnitrophica bacterium]|nr:aldolase [Candidatus Omnitrophota bacterium]
MNSPLSLQVRPSRILRRIREEGYALGVMVALSDPRVAEIAAQNGFDCLWLDQEHMGGNYREIENLVRAAKMYDVDTVVRVPKGSYSDLIRPLEL